MLFTISRDNAIEIVKINEFFGSIMKTNNYSHKFLFWMTNHEKKERLYYHKNEIRHEQLFYILIYMIFYRRKKEIKIIFPLFILAINATKLLQA